MRRSDEGLGRSRSDVGVRNLWRVCGSVVFLLGAWYGLLIRQALVWTPARFIREKPLPVWVSVELPAWARPGPAATAGAPERPLGLPAAPSRFPNVERGRRLFHTVGCAVCHGVDGTGGVRNPNYVRDTIPALDRLAERLLLFEKADIQRVIEGLARHDLLDTLPRSGLPRWPVIRAQYESLRSLIWNGNPAGRRDPQGPEPIPMPAWKSRLSPEDVDDILAFLLSRSL
jgi:mono/diheme cytochrome c family protein